MSILRMSTILPRGVRTIMSILRKIICPSSQKKTNEGKELDEFIKDKCKECKWSEELDGLAYLNSIEICGPAEARRYDYHV